MARVTLSDLVSQAEKQGVTLAEVISRTLDADELDVIQAELQEELSESYKSIENYMSGVEVPSLWELMARDELGQAEA